MASSRREQPIRQAVQRIWFEDVILVRGYFVGAGRSLEQMGWEKQLAFAFLCFKLLNQFVRKP